MDNKKNNSMFVIPNLTYYEKTTTIKRIVVRNILFIIF